MTKVFVSYTYSDENPYSIRLMRLVEYLKSEFQVFCNIEQDDTYRREGWSTKRIMESALAELHKSDVVIVFAEERMSQGMLIEFGYAHCLGKPILLLTEKNVCATSSRALATQEITYDADRDSAYFARCVEQLKAWTVSGPVPH